MGTSITEINIFLTFQAPIDSLQYKLYEEGIRFACFALCGYSIACIAYSLVSEKIIKCLGLVRYWFCDHEMIALLCYQYIIKMKN